MAITYEIKNTGGFIVRLLNNSSSVIGNVIIKDEDSSTIYEHDFGDQTGTVLIKIPANDISKVTALNTIKVTIDSNGENYTYTHDLSDNNNNNNWPYAIYGG